MVHIRTAALLGLATFVAADIDCGDPFESSTGTASGSVYHSGSTADFTIQCHEYTNGPNGWDWELIGYFDTFAACVDACAADPACLAATQHPNHSCMSSKTVKRGTNEVDADTVYNTAYRREKPVVVVPPKPAPLNCKDKSSNGTIFTPQGSTQKYQILCDYQYGGNTLGGSKRAETFEECVGFCDTTAGCFDVIYSDAKYCWLKSSKTNGYASGGWYTAVKVTDSTTGSNSNPNSNTGSNNNGFGAINCFDNSADKTIYTAPGGTYDIRCNFQYDGDTLGSSKRTETLEDCVKYCDATSGCVDAIWSNAKYCWLKSSKKGNGYNSGGWFSAIKRSGSRCAETGGQC